MGSSLLLTLSFNIEVKRRLDPQLQEKLLATLLISCELNIGQQIRKENDKGKNWRN